MAKLEDVLKELDQRLTAIETKLQQKENVPSVQVPTGLSSKQVTRPNAPSTYSSRTTGQSFDSSSILAIIGIIFVILAGVFFIKITVDSGWMTPVRQILLAACVGLTFFLTPQFFPKAEKEYGALLAGAGTTILHLTWLGAYFLHHILDARTALICATLVGVLSILANFDKGNRAFVLVAMAGTYLAAPLVGYSTGELPILSVFLMIWNISFSAIALVTRRRDIIFIASYYAVFTVLLLSGKANGIEQQFELLRLQLLQFLVFSSALVSYSVYRKDPLTTDESVAVLPLLLLFYFSTGNLMNAIIPVFAPYFGITLGAFVLGIYFFARSFLSAVLKSGPTLTAFAAITFVHSFYFQILGEASKPLAALILAVFVMGVWIQSPRARKEYFWPLAILLSTFIYGAILTVISVQSIQSMYFYNWAYGAVALFAIIWISSTQDSKSDVLKYTPLVLGFGHLEIMLGLYRFAQQISWSGALFVTITWGIYAGLVLVVSCWRRDKVLGNSALTILLAVSLKAFFYDVSNTSSLIRVGCLLAEGLLLYCCGWIFKKMQSWKV